MLTWRYITSAEYENISDKDKYADELFFLSDTREIYRGTENFSEHVVLYDDGTEPEIKSKNKIYINSTTLEGKIWTGISWVTIIEKVIWSIYIDDEIITIEPGETKTFTKDWLPESTSSLEVKFILDPSIEDVFDKTEISTTVYDSGRQLSITNNSSYPAIGKIRVSNIVI